MEERLTEFILATYHVSRHCAKGIVILLFSFLLLTGCGNESEEKSSQVRAVAAKLGLSEEGHMQISPGDHCTVCAMPVEKHLKYAAAIELNDGASFYFCGPQCMIRSWLHPEIFLGTDKSRLKKAVVTGYFSGKHLDAHSAVFVSGSDVMGPMGPTFIPLASQEEANVFIKRHGGTITSLFIKINDTVWEKSTGRKVIPEESR